MRGSILSRACQSSRSKIFVVFFQMCKKDPLKISPHGGRTPPLTPRSFMKTIDPTVKQNLIKEIGNQIIRYGDVEKWPPRSPDLTPLDFFLWGYLKLQM